MYVTQSNYWWEFFSAMEESWKKLKTSNVFSLFIVWVIIHCLLVSCKKINHSCCMLVTWSSLQLTSKQWIIIQQFTARADLFLKQLCILASFTRILTFFLFIWAIKFLSFGLYNNLIGNQIALSFFMTWDCFSWNIYCENLSKKEAWLNYIFTSEGFVVSTFLQTLRLTILKIYY